MVISETLVQRVFQKWMFEQTPNPQTAIQGKPTASAVGKSASLQICIVRFRDGHKVYWSCLWSLLNMEFYFKDPSLMRKSLMFPMDFLSFSCRVSPSIVDKPVNQGFSISTIL